MAVTATIQEKINKISSFVLRLQARPGRTTVEIFSYFSKQTQSFASRVDKDSCELEKGAEG